MEKQEQERSMQNKHRLDRIYKFMEKFGDTVKKDEKAIQLREDRRLLKEIEEKEKKEVENEIYQKENKKEEE